MMLNYVSLLLSFLKKGYKVDFFSKTPPKKGVLILRHDVDFDVQYAYDMSLIEDQLGVKSTYFFLLHSKSYNLIEHNNMKLVRSIIERGHVASIHFDPTLYENIDEGFLREKNIFENLFDTKVEYISIHRPSSYFLNNNKTICGVNHTYQSAYFDEIRYFSDSQGVFRYGHPCLTQEFINLQSIQLLIHPIWWMTKSKDPVSKLHEYLERQNLALKEHIALNCQPFKKYIETV
jgi:hypothetical protein